MKHSITRELDQASAWAVVLAGGSGTRVQSLTRKIEGDQRPKQFCRMLGGRSLLGDTRERLRPIFPEDRTVFVMTKAHEMFYTEELSDVDASRIVAQPLNRGTGVAVIVALLRVLQEDANAVVAFFPSDHYFADNAAFVATVQSAIGAATKQTESIILLGAQPLWPEVEYGWIEPGAPVSDGGQAPLLRVNRFWEKPPRATARELMRTGGLWNTFVTIGRAGAFLNLLHFTVPAAVAEFADALEFGDVERAYRDASSIDFSKDVLSVEPHRLLVMRDAASGWADLGNPARVVNTLVQNRIEPEWLLKMRGSYFPGPTTNSRMPRRRRVGMIASSCGVK
jgi:mannose-1-phosphate guanylyltransferase